MRARRFFHILLTGLLFLLLAVSGASAWLLLSQGGLVQSLDLLEWASQGMVRIHGAQGRLLGPLTLEAVEIQLDGDHYHLHELRLDWVPQALLDKQLDIPYLRAERLELQFAENSTIILPDSLQLPFALHVAALEIGAISWHEAPDPFACELSATLKSDGHAYQLEALHVYLDAGELSGHGTLAASAPFALAAEAELATDSTAALGTGSTDSPRPVRGEGAGERGNGVSASTKLAKSLPPALSPNPSPASGRGEASSVSVSTVPHALIVRMRAEGTPEALEVQLDGIGKDFSLAAKAQLEPLARQPLKALQLSARGLDPQRFLPQAPRARLTLAADLKPDADGALAGILRVDNQAAAALDRQGLPFSRADAEMRLSWQAAPYRLTLNRLRLALDAAGAANGRVDLLWPEGETLPQGQADLEIVRLNPHALHAALFPARLSGRLRFSGDATAQQATLALADGPRRIEAKLDHRGGKLTASHLLLAQGKAELAGSGSVLLNKANDWRFSGKLQHFDPAAFVDRLPRAELNADFAADGRVLPQLAGNLRFQLTSSRLTGLPLAGQGDLAFSGIDQSDALITANGKAWLRGTLELALGDSRLKAQGGWGGPAETLALNLDAPNLAQHRVLLPGLAGALNLAATLNGFPTRPEVDFKLRARRLSLPDSGDVGELDASGNLQGETLKLALIAENLGLRHTPKAERLPRLTLHIDGTRAQHRLEAVASLPEARRLQLQARGALIEAPADWRDSGWQGQLERLQLDGELPVSLIAEGEFAVSRKALGGHLNGKIPDLRGLGPAIGGNLTIAGALDFDTRLSGRPAAPRLRGQVRGQGLSVGLLDHNVHLREGKLALRFEESLGFLEQLDFIALHDPPARAARVSGFQQTKNPGRLRVTGKFDLDQRQAQFDATLDRLPLSQRPDRWLVGTGTARLTQAGERLRLDAQLRADAGFIAKVVASHPKLSADVVVLGREAAPPPNPRADTDIRLDLGERFHLRAAGLSARLAGKLRVRGNNDLPLAANGSITAQDATFEAYGQRLVVERGIVNFQGPLDDPGLNVLAVRKGTLVEAGVTVSGTAQRPVVRLVSTPTVPDSEKLSWIVLGRVPDAGGSDSSLLLAAAGSILGGQGEGITSQIAQAFGVDEFSLRQSENGDTLSSQIFSVGKRLSARSWLSYEQGLNAAAGALKFTYTLTPRVSVVTRAGEETALDVFYNFSFD